VNIERHGNDAEPRLNFFFSSCIERVSARPHARFQHLARRRLVERSLKDDDARGADQAAQVAAEVARKEMRRPDESRAATGSGDIPGHPEPAIF
jgi:hypothetical protein